MAETKKMVEILDSLINLGINVRGVKYSRRFTIMKEGKAILTEIKGIVKSYPIILKALEEANENIDNFIKFKPQITRGEIDEFVEIVGEFDAWEDGYENIEIWFKSRGISLKTKEEL